MEKDDTPPPPSPTLNLRPQASPPRARKNRTPDPEVSEPEDLVNPDPASPSAEVVYEVLADLRVPRSGGFYTLRAGKKISSFGYNIEELLTLGAKLRKV